MAICHTAKQNKSIKPLRDENALRTVSNAIVQHDDEAEKRYTTDRVTAKAARRQSFSLKKAS